MKMRAEPHLLLSVALMLASSAGCGEGTIDDELEAGGPPAVLDSSTGPIVGGGNDSGASASLGGQPAPGPGAGPGAGSGGNPGATPSIDAGGGGARDAGAATDSSTSSPQTDSGTSQGDSGMPPSGSGNVPPAESADKDGPFAPMHITNGGPKGTSWVFYSKDIGKDGMKHPIFNWGPGAGTGPSQYTDHLNRLASHGFVVISQPSSGTGKDEVPALDWLIAQNDKAGSPFHQKLDVKKVGAGGHSKGSLTTMAMAKDPRLGLYVLVCGGGSGGAGAADIHGPTVILGGDGDIGTPNYEGDYSEIKAPVVFLTKSATGHIDCARNNLAPWVAFMRWTFYGEEKWKPDFFNMGTYCKSPWKCKSKNY